MHQFLRLLMFPFKRRLIIFLILFIFQNLSFAQPQPIYHSFIFEGRTRNYIVYRPQNYHPNMPVVLNLHGYRLLPTVYADYTLMHVYADTSGFIVVYPEGSYFNSNIGWNNGLRNHPLGATDTTSNDVGFISALIDTLKAQYDISLDSVYCCGFSMGGEMTYRLAIEQGHRFAAIASVSGKINDISGNAGIPLRSIPLLHIHGTADGVEFYGQGPGNLWSVDSTLNFWIQNNSCQLPPDTILLPDLDPNDGCTVQKIGYSNCSDSSKIIFYKVIDGGHSWPGAPTTPSWAYPTNRDINANSEIWNFFKNYDNPLVNIAWTRNAEIIPMGYIPTQGDTLFIKAFTVNPQNHPVLVNAKILGTGTSFTDSLILFDDGMHGDENPNDNIYGNSKFLSGIPEDEYFVDIYTDDLTEGTSQKYRKLNYYFLNKGPVVLDHYRITSSDTIPHHGDRLKFEFALRNDGMSATVNNITSQVVALDTFSIVYPQITTQYGDIPAGSTVVGSEKQYIEFDIDPYDTVISNYKINIYSNGNLFWSDTFSELIINGLEKLKHIYPAEFNLNQNYPNPFNPKTMIQFSIPQAEYVTLKICNILGQEVATLVSEKLKSGNYQYSWDAGSLASGVYLYHLQAGEFAETRKMILIQ